MSHTIVPVKTYVLIFVALMVLLAATVGVYHINLGALNTFTALAIAFVKAGLVALYFMHARYSGRMTWIVAGAAFFWLAILITLTLADYLSRGWLPAPGP
jgi:cytochrome c oxidase subunit IV